MRIGKIIAALVLPVQILFALVTSTSPVRLWAQLPPSNPNLGPAATPSAPPQLSQPAVSIGIPPLAVIPTPRAPTPWPPRGHSIARDSDRAAARTGWAG